MLGAVLVVAAVALVQRGDGDVDARGPVVATTLAPGPATTAAPRAVTPRGPGTTTRPPTPVPVAPATTIRRDVPAPTSTSSTPTAPIATLRPVEIRDPMINDFLALSLLVPDGWQTRGGIVWDPNLYPLAGGALTVSDPSGAVALETFFPPSYSWVTDPVFQRPGANWLGSIMAPPRPAAQALRELVLPQLRPGAEVLGVRPVDVSMLEGLDEGVRLRIRYGGPQGPVEEEFLAGTSRLDSTVGGTTTTQWGFQFLYSMRAPAGQLDAALPTLEGIVASVSVDPLWYANYLTVVEMFIARGYEAIRLAGELSQYLTRTYAEINQIQQEAWEDQQRAYDRIHDNFMDYIRDTQKVQHPNGTQTRTPAGVACALPDGTIVVLPQGSTCAPGTTHLPTVT